MRIIVSGGWSYGNIGDEAIAASTIFLLDKYFPEAEKVYTAYEPNNFKANHLKYAIKSVHKSLSKYDEKCLNDKEILCHLEEYGLNEFAELFDDNSVFIMSGGGYFHEHWKSQFVSRILEIEIAKMYGAKVFVLGQSIGPIYSLKGKLQLKSALNKVDYLAIRDKSSFELLNSLELNVKVNKIPDLAIIIADIVKKREPSQRKKNC